MCTRHIDNNTPHVRTNQTQWEAWAEYVRTFEPYSWFGTFTFKKDILTYTQENPCVYTSVYTWKDKTGKCPHGTYVRESEKKPWRDSGSYERTGTYVQQVQEEHSERMYRRWSRKLNEEIFGTRFRDRGKGLLHVFAIEYQKRGVAHIHSLIKEIPSHISRIQFEKVWERLHPNNGFANIFPYDPKRGAAGYLAKYVLKGGKVDIVAPPCFREALSANIAQRTSFSSERKPHNPPRGF
ncbi:MAG: hypothetical protein AMXMBFR44_7000 [Candidatus Campbellbacteria bacterium]